MRDAVARGELKPGEPLPSTRALAEALGVSRGTVVEAFDQLVAEGIFRPNTALVHAWRPLLIARRRHGSERERPSNCRHKRRHSPT
ncbi:GntR family transcriptional regulator [Cupriavidus basilensis]